MNLLDRYVQAVKKCLPKAGRDDIVKELSENILSQMEDKEAELGRPLNEAEQEAILKSHGHPVQVAGRYRRDQGCLAFGRVLIGPVLFPFYARVLSIITGVTAAACVIVAIALGKPILDAIPAILTHVFLQFGIITLIFAAAQKHLDTYPDRWDPRKPFAAPPAVKDETRVSRVESFAQFVFLAVFLSWLLAVRGAPDLFADDRGGVIQFGPVWRQVFWPVALVTLAGIVQAVVNLVRPKWTGYRSVSRVVTEAVWVATLVWMVMAGDWILLADASAVPMREDLRKLVLHANRYVIFPSLLITAIVSAVQFLLEVRRLIRGRHTGVSAELGMNAIDRGFLPR